MVNIGFISLDILILIAIFGLLFFLGAKNGKKLILSLILATYPSLMIFKNFPYVSFDSGMPEAIAFIVIYVLIVSVLIKYVSKKKLYTPSRKFVDFTLLIISYLILVIAITSKSVISLQNLYTFSGVIPSYINQLDFGVILIIPLVVMLLTAKSDKF
jgi:hypothetical protein